jgi:flavin-dependent dehydrogenase
MPWLASPLPRFAVRTDWPANVVPVGNAAAALEPIGGEGMGLAMRSAELAADAIDVAVRAARPVDAVALQSSYRKLWQTRRTACRAVAMAVARPALMEAGLPLVGTSIASGRLAMAAMGKVAR